MLFSDFSDLCTRLEAISGRLEMIDVLQGELPSLSEGELPVFVRFIMGRIFPDWRPEKVGVGPNLLYEGVAYVAGIKKESVVRTINREGDVGRAVEHILTTKEQTSFFTTALELEEVYRDFTYIAGVGGSRSQREKLKVIRRLFANAQPVEGKYLARLLLGELRIGIGEGNIRDAIARAFDVPSVLVEHAYQARNDLGEVALLAREGADALSGVRIELFRPVKMMLAQQGSIGAMLAEHGAVAAEMKYDGSRFQFHKKGGECRIYSRKLEDVTHALPDIVQALVGATKHDVILDGEVIAVRDGKPLPFQFVLRRFRRKHDLDLHIDEITMIPWVFDLLFLDGTTYIDATLSERRAHLESVLGDYIAPQLVSDNTEEVEEFYREALEKGHEGIMIKAPSSPYTPGVRGKNWVKIKPAVDTLDLAVIGAEWGEGRRAKLYGSFLLACRDSGEFIPVSKVATGFSDEMLAIMYDLLKDTVLSTSGKEIVFEPSVVIEVGYAEIQRSPNYSGGYALRFPRFICLREDKSVDDVESLAQIGERYYSQVTSVKP
ncbi:MAG: ATP-dependent DNA ligase [Methanomicrobiaceae archaeon]|nr:ATP-dependent DNA ligase [Methanomicrobiaceae archaeon]